MERYFMSDSNSNSSSSSSNKQPQIKQAVISAEVVKANSSPAKKRIKIAGFSGAFLDARFDDSGLSEGEVSESTLALLRSQFPKARIKEVIEQVEEVTEEEKG
jgi:hypothetical protein